MGDSAGPTVPADHGEPFLDAAWTEAIDATELLRDALIQLGLVEDFPRLRGDVNVYGRPMVTVGRISTQAARRLASILAMSLPGTPVPAAGTIGEQRGLPFGGDVPELYEMRGDPQRLPA
jgi:hypothetical protein